MVPSSSSHSEALTVIEAAQKLSCSPGTVRNLIKRGELRSVRIGRLVRVPVAAIEDVLAGPSEADRIAAADRLNERSGAPDGITDPTVLAEVAKVIGRGR